MTAVRGSQTPAGAYRAQLHHPPRSPAPPAPPHRALPTASPTISPGATRSPSLRAQLRLTAGSTRANTACATHTPASTPLAFARKVARACVPSGTLRVGQGREGTVREGRRKAPPQADSPTVDAAAARCSSRM